jgi:HAD superfamily phosphatase (TIGR01668 family)
MNGSEPCERHKTIHDIDFESLLPRMHYIIDIDNTLLKLNSKIVDEETVLFLKKLQDNRVIQKICLVSNIIIPLPSYVHRVESVAHQLDAHFICAYGYHAKPHKQPFERAMRLMNATPLSTVMVGDQISTDIRGGNALGIYTILVEPLGRHAWLTQLRNKIFND